MFVIYIACIYNFGVEPFYCQFMLRLQRYYAFVSIFVTTQHITILVTYNMRILLNRTSGAPFEVRIFF